MSTLAAVEQILRMTKTPMSVKDIVQEAGDSLPTRSKTPDTVVARDLSMDIKKFGEESRFVRTSPGRYTIREFVLDGSIPMGVAPAASTSSQPTQEAETTDVLDATLGERRGLRSSTSSESGAARETEHTNFGSAEA